MDLKLQQAIVATRSGRTDVAQHLLTQLISEQPDNAHAWFLLGHIVDSKDRQIRYLQKAVELDPENPVAKTQVAKLITPTVPVPVIAQEEAGGTAQSNEAEKRSVDAEPAPPVKVETATIDPNNHGTPTELPEWLQDLETKKLGVQQAAGNQGSEWLGAAGTPKREPQDIMQRARILHIPQEPSQANSSSDRTPEEVWLLRILAVMVVVAAIVLGFLVLLILF